MSPSHASPPGSAGRETTIHATTILMAVVLVACAAGASCGAGDRQIEERRRLDGLVLQAAERLRRDGASRTTITYSLGARTEGRLVVAGADADLETLEDYGVSLDAIALFRASRRPVVALSLREPEGRRRLLYWEPSFDAVGARTVWISEGRAVTLTVALRGQDPVVVDLR
ncbi:MAG: hypothetical protein AB7O67_17925 [Vicinamibacterales bacterium]